MSRSDLNLRSEFNLKSEEIENGVRRDLRPLFYTTVIVILYLVQYLGSHSGIIIASEASYIFRGVNLE